MYILQFSISWALGRGATTRSEHKQLLYFLLIGICFSGTIGFTLKFTTYINDWLPFFPNIFDSIFLITAVSFLTFLSIKSIRKDHSHRALESVGQLHNLNANRDSGDKENNLRL